jgi:hypothetical protein
MGDRAMCEIKTSDGSLYVYVHWHGNVLPGLAKQAIIFAKPRWTAESYCTRIIVDQITNDGRDSTTGFGLMLKPNAEDEYNHDNPSVVIDIPKQQLIVRRGVKGGLVWSFSELQEDIEDEPRSSNGRYA